MASSSAGRQADLGQCSKMNNPTRNRFVEHFDDDGSLSARDQVPGCAVNEAHTAMWIPEDAELPIKMSVEEYDERPVGSWWRGIEEIDNSEVEVIVLSLGNVIHVLKAELVERLAAAADVTVEEIISRARMHESRNKAPAVFEMDDGRVLIAPRATDQSNITKVA